MCLMSYWQVIVSIMVKPLILKISFIEINEKMSKFLKKEGGGMEILLTSLTLPHSCACHGLFLNVKWAEVVHFVDIGGIVDHRC
jgi:hypothetical protein